MYWRSVVLPITDFEDKVTLVVDLPGVSPEGKRVLQPELAASTIGQRSEMRDRGRIVAIARAKTKTRALRNGVNRQGISSSGGLLYMGNYG